MKKKVALTSFRKILEFPPKPQFAMGIEKNFMSFAKNRFSGRTKNFPDELPGNPKNEHKIADCNGDS